MKKKLLALAIAGAFSAPVLAADTVTVYGTLNQAFGQFSATGSTAAGGLQSNLAGIAVGADQPSHNAVSSQSSNIGFKGSEDLGGGLKAGFQIESAVFLDGAGSAIGSRNTGITLSGNFGTVLLGQWDTPYKTISIAPSSFYSTSAASYNAIIGSPGYGVASATLGSPNFSAAAAASATVPVTGVANGPAADAAFDRRQGNSVQYWSPDFNGFSVRLLYSANEAKTAVIDPRIYGLSATYSNGPFYAAYAYERHNDFFGSRLMDSGAAALVVVAGQSSQDTGNKLNLAYTFGNTQVGLVYERLSYNTTGRAAAFLTNYDRNAYVLNVNHKMGAGKIMALYGNASDASCQYGVGVCNANGTGAKMYAIGYDHAMSKRTNLYATYVRMDNKTDARYTFGTQQTGSAAPSAGADPTTLFAGIRHTF